MEAHATTVTTVVSCEETLVEMDELRGALLAASHGCRQREDLWIPVKSCNQRRPTKVREFQCWPSVWGRFPIVGFSDWQWNHYSTTCIKGVKDLLIQWLSQRPWYIFPLLKSLAGLFRCHSLCHQMAIYTDWAAASWRAKHFTVRFAGHLTVRNKYMLGSTHHCH